jgi:hypothetical protein
MTSVEKRVTNLEEKTCGKAEHKGDGEIKVVTVPGGTSTIVRAGSLIEVPGGAKFRLPRGLSGLIMLRQDFYWEGEPIPHLPDPAHEIARQRAQGKKLIVVDVPWKIEDERQTIT